jgi:hypothetical protein
MASVWVFLGLDFLKEDHDFPQSSFCSVGIIFCSAGNKMHQLINTQVVLSLSLEYRRSKKTVS